MYRNFTHYSPCKLLRILMLCICTGISFSTFADEKADDAIFTSNKKGLESTHVSVGIDVGSTIDLTANNLSTFDADLTVGYKNKCILLAGVGAGIHKAFGSANNFIPVYGIIRTSFSSVPRRFFLNLTGGYSFNTVSSSAKNGGMILSAGLGIRLASSRSFRSHLILSYGFMHLNKVSDVQPPLSRDDISTARLTIGVSF